LTAMVLENITNQEPSGPHSLWRSEDPVATSDIPVPGRTKRALLRDVTQKNATTPACNSQRCGTTLDAAADGPQKRQTVVVRPPQTKTVNSARAKCPAKGPSLQSKASSRLVESRSATTLPGKASSRLVESKSATTLQGGKAESDKSNWANALWQQQERCEAASKKEAELLEIRKAQSLRLAAVREQTSKYKAELETVVQSHGSAAVLVLHEQTAQIKAKLEAGQNELVAEEHKERQLAAGIHAKSCTVDRNRQWLALIEQDKEQKLSENEAKTKCHAILLNAALQAKAELARREELLAQGVIEARLLHNGYLSLKGNIRVFCRLRPLLASEADDAIKVDIQDDSHLTVFSGMQKNVTGLSERPTSHDFSFDHIFGPHASQAAVFEEIALLIQSALDGYRVAIFAYGQTGSGKTHTMTGEPNPQEAVGIIPRAVDLIFREVDELQQKGWKFDIYATLLEVYNEVVYDVLAQRGGADAATGAAGNSVIADQRSASTETTHGSSAGGQYNARRVQDAEGVHVLLRRAARQRHTASTACNDRSSRSHAVFQLSFEGRKDSGGQRREVKGLLSLVDLAGSERVEKSGVVGERLREAQHINRSLSALGDVIEVLARRGQQGHGSKESGSGHVPYRNSRLTMLLKDSLGGDSKALMFVNISLCLRHLPETLSSLRFASKVHACNVGVAKRHAAEKGVPGAATRAGACPQREEQQPSHAQSSRKVHRSKSCPASPDTARKQRCDLKDQT